MASMDEGASATSPARPDVLGGKEQAVHVRRKMKH